MNARFYNPTSGRFISQDSYSGNAYEPWTQHLYSYSTNNPVNMVDPTGHMPTWLFSDDNDSSVNGIKTHYVLRNGAAYQPGPDTYDPYANMKWYEKAGAMALTGVCVLGLYAGLFGAVYVAGEAGPAVAASPALPKCANFFGKLASKLGSIYESIFGSNSEKVVDDVTEGSVNPNTIRFSQSSVNSASKIIESMKTNGWLGKPIDVVRMPDGLLTTVDNTRVLASRYVNIDANVNIHDFCEMLSENNIERFTTPRGGVPLTWGDAVLNRIGNQNLLYRTIYPYGSNFIGWDGR